MILSFIFVIRKLFSLTGLPQNCVWHLLSEMEESYSEKSAFSYFKHAALMSHLVYLTCQLKLFWKWKHFSLPSRLWFFFFFFHSGDEMLPTLMLEFDWKHGRHVELIRVKNNFRSLTGSCLTLTSHTCFRLPLVGSWSSSLKYYIDNGIFYSYFKYI